MEDRRAQHGVGAARSIASLRCSSRPAPPEAITGIPTASATARGQLEVVAVLGPVAVHAGEQDLPRSALGSLARPLDDVAPGRDAAAVDVDLEAARPARLASIASTTHWAPNVSASSVISSGRATAAELTDTLSAPASSTACASSRERMPPPIVNGMKTLSAVRRAS